VAAKMAGRLGDLLGSDKRNAFTIDQRFCVGLVSGSGYKLKLGVCNESTGKKEVILIDYYNLPIRCRYCLSTDHLVRDCPRIVGKTEEEPPPVEKSSSEPQPNSEGTNSNLPLALAVKPGDNPTILITEET
jgi:hypothetical protein